MSTERYVYKIIQNRSSQCQNQIWYIREMIIGELETNKKEWNSGVREWNSGKTIEAKEINHVQNEA